jgi:hypothetical protein
MPPGDIASLLGGSTASARRRRGRRRRCACDLDATALELVPVRLRPEQKDALAREARHRALVRASVVTDESEIVREALDAWLAGRG